MSLLDTVLNGFTGGIAGGITGLVGIGVQKFAEFKSKQLEMQADLNKFDHEIKMKEADAAIMAQEWAARTKVAEVEANAVVDAEDAKAFAVALDSEPKRYSDGLVANVWQAWTMFMLDVLRGIVRPTLTLYLCAITTKVYLDAAGIMLRFGSSMTVEQAAVLNNKIVDALLYLTTTAVLFWFGTRPGRAK